MANREGTISSIFGIAFLLQVISFVIFVLDNLNSLDAVPVTIDVAGTEQTITVNVYALMGLVGIVFAAILLASVSILGIGLNSEGTKTIARYLSFGVVFTLSSISLAFYLGILGSLFTVVEILLVLVYLLYIIVSYS